MDYAKTQKHFRHLIFHEDGKIPSGWFQGGSLSDEKRLNIYRQDYWGRMEEVMVETYPVCKRILGNDVFRHLVVHYLSQHPSRHYDLARVGKEFSLFVHADEISKDLPFLRDLSYFEWHLMQAFYSKTPGIFFEMESKWPIAELMHTVEKADDEIDIDMTRQNIQTFMIVQKPDGQVEWETKSKANLK